MLRRIHLGLFAIVIAAASCSQQRAASPPEKRREPGKDQILKQIKTSGNPIYLYRLKAQAEEKGLSAEARAALENRLQAIRPTLTPKPISESLDLLAAELQNVGAGQYEFALLFLPKKPIDTDYRIYAHARVDKKHEEYLPENRRQYGFLNWDFGPKPAMTSWKAGEPVVVSRVVNASAIPYNIIVGITGPEGREGQQVAVGWLAGLEGRG